MTPVAKLYNAFSGIQIVARDIAFPAIAFTVGEDGSVAGTLIQPDTGKGMERFYAQHGPFDIRLSGHGHDGPLESFLRSVSLDRPPIYTMGVQDPDSRVKLPFHAQSYESWTHVAP